MSTLVFALLAAVVLWILWRELRPASGERQTAVAEAPSLPVGPVQVPVEDSLDLHAFSPRDQVSVAEEYLVAAREAGLLQVRIIHGRGTGFQRDQIRRLLEDNPLVIEYSDAPPPLGGWGATIVRLEPETKGGTTSEKPDRDATDPGP